MREWHSKNGNVEVLWPLMDLIPDCDYSDSVSKIDQKHALVDFVETAAEVCKGILQENTLKKRWVSIGENSDAVKENLTERNRTNLKEE